MFDKKQLLVDFIGFLEERGGISNGGDACT